MPSRLYFLLLGPFFIGIVLVANAETETLDPLIVRSDSPAETKPSGAGDFAISLPGGRGYQDVLATLPNVQPGTPSSTAFALRGLGQDNVIFSLGTESNQLVNVSTGGLSSSYATLACLSPLMWDIGEVSLTRGPVLFGTGVTVMGGELRLEPRAPQFVNEGRFTLEAGEYSTWRTGFTQNFVIDPDRLALRLNFAGEGSDGDVTNLFNGDDKFAATRHQLYRGQLRYRPAGNDEAVYDLRVDFERAGGNTFGQAFLLPGHDFYDRVVDVNYSAALPAEREAVITKARWELGDGWWADGEASFQLLKADHSTDFDGSSALAWIYHYKPREQRLTGSARFGKKSDHFNWTGGLYGEVSDYRFSFFGRGLGPVPDGRPFMTDTDEDVEMAAAYLNGEWEYAPRFWLTGGLRLDYQSRSQTTLATLDGNERGRGRVDVDNAEWLPQLGTEWRGDDAKAGLSISKLYRPPGAAVAQTLGISNPYGSERGWEIDATAGKKWRQFSADARAFYAHVNNAQVPYLAPGGFPILDNFIGNTAKSERSGVELEVAWKQGAFSTGLTGGYLHTEFENLNINGVNRSGQAFPFAPEWTAGAYLAWKPVTGFFGEASCNWADTTYAQVDSPLATKLEARTLVSARAGYRWSDLELYVFGSNLLDEEYAASKNDIRGAGLPISARLGMPRMLGAGLTVTW